MSQPTFRSTNGAGSMAKMGEARKQKLKRALNDWLAERAESFGTIEQLPSVRLRVRFRVNDARFSSTHTYDSLIDARAWLDEQRKAVLGGYWTDPHVAAAEEKEAAASSVSVNDLFAVSMDEGGLKPRSRDRDSSPLASSGRSRAHRQSQVVMAMGECVP